MSQHQEQRAILQRLLDVAVENNHYLKRVYHFLQLIVHLPTHIRITFEGATMPVTLNVGQSTIATATEADAAGVNVPIAEFSVITWATSDPTIATSANNPDGTGTFTAIAAGTVTVTVTDASNGLTTSDTITVVTAPPPPDKPVSIAISFSTPQ